MLATEGADGIELETIRGAVRNPSPEPYLIAELLWKDEAISLLEEFGLAKGWRAKRIKAIHWRLADHLPFALLAERVRSALKSRSNWLGQNSSHQLDMTIDAYVHPMLQSLWGRCASGNVVDHIVGPTIRNLYARAMAYHACRVSDKLNIHVDASGPSVRTPRQIKNSLGSVYLTLIGKPHAMLAGVTSRANGSEITAI